MAVSLKKISQSEVFDKDPSGYVVNPNEAYHTLTRKNKVESVTYAWNDIDVWVEGEGKGCFGKNDKPSEDKTILHSVNGIVRPKEMLALMGSSGAGKTTLLNMLTFRNTGSLKWSGKRCINGVDINANALASISAYIQQEDIFIGVLTPREHLRFHATLRMHHHIPTKQRFARVEEVIHEIGLSACADTIIGIPGMIKGISGGQRKRLAVASEILTDPPLMFFDEPTTGLDSYMARNIVTILKDLAAKGKTIICTIHQPSSEVYALFDRILLMSEGRTAFLGDTKDVLPFFATLGYPCPVNYNPADFFIHSLAIRPGNEDECLEKAKKICKSFESSPAAEQIKELVEEGTERSESGMGIEAMTSKKMSRYKSSYLTQFWSVYKRANITILRDPALLRIQLMQTVIVALIIGVVYFGQELDQEGVQNINGSIFLVMANVTFSNVFGVLNTFWGELPVFMREHHNGMYSTGIYYTAKTVAELPMYILMPFIYTSIVYYMVGLNSSIDRFLIACCVLVLMANVGSSYGYMIATFSSSLDMSLGLAPVFIMPFMIFGGSFMNKDSTPVYFIWLQYLSWFLYGNEALSVNQWKGIEEISCEFNSSCIATGAAVLDELHFEEDNFATSVLALAGLLAAFRVLGFLALMKKTYKVN